MQGAALSGGDRIFIELSKKWEHKCNITLFVSSEGWEICKREGLQNVKHNILSSSRLNRYGYFVNYLYRTCISVIKLSKLKISKDNIVYSSSDFWPDAVPAFIIKLRNPEIKWIAAFYLFAPKPFQAGSPYKGCKWVIGLFYWLTQVPIFWIVRKYADIVFVTSEPDKGKFVTPKRNSDKVIVIRGGVNIEPSEKYLNSEKIIQVEQRKYDACFVGRFHYQKGILELIEIWRLVCCEKPDAKLAMVGTGPLEVKANEKIDRLRLRANIVLLGFKNGEEKYDIFKQSKMILHPAMYDSGGMAAAEGMAWKLPGVGFDLESLRTYYPKGMIKTKCFDLQEFANNILELFKNKDLYNQRSKEALDLICEEWDWNKRADFIYSKVCTFDG